MPRLQIAALFLSSSLGRSIWTGPRIERSVAAILYVPNFHGVQRKLGHIPILDMYGTRFT